MKSNFIRNTCVIINDISLRDFKKVTKHFSLSIKAIDDIFIPVSNRSFEKKA